MQVGTVGIFGGLVTGVGQYLVDVFCATSVLGKHGSSETVPKRSGYRFLFAISTGSGQL